MKLKDYIIEAISSGKYRHGKGLVTVDTTSGEMMGLLEKCGINWKPYMKAGQTIDNAFAFKVLDEWNYNYDMEEVGEGRTSITVLVIVTRGKCFEFFWDTLIRNSSGPVTGLYYKKSGGRKLFVTSDLDKTIDELNKELSTDLF
jgi:hypothetical protein